MCWPACGWQNKKMVSPPNTQARILRQLLTKQPLPTKTKDGCRHRKIFRHTHTHLSITGSLSRGHIHFNTHSHLQKKGGKIRRKTTGLRTTLTTGHATLRGDSQQHKETEKCTHWQGTMWHWGRMGCDTVQDLVGEVPTHLENFNWLEFVTRVNSSSLKLFVRVRRED